MTAVEQTAGGPTADEELEASGRIIPARRTAGIRPVSAGRGRACQVMDAPPWLCDGDGSVLPGALGILADSALGTAIMSSVASGMSMVTSHLHLELFGAIPPAVASMVAEGRRRSLVDHFGLAEGEVRTADGHEIARATIGSVLIPRQPAPAAPSPGPAGPTSDPAARPARRAHRLLAESPAHQRFGTRVVRAGTSGVTISVCAAPDLANSNGGLHGGIGVLLGERAFDLALQVALGRPATDGTAPVLRLVELRAAFLRGVRADGSRIRCRASVVHLGRRLAAARGEVLTADGRVAVLIDANYVAAGPDVAVA
jgi:uncharacterized protein (TIGR00369 family)